MATTWSATIPTCPRRPRDPPEVIYTGASVESGKVKGTINRGTLLFSLISTVNGLLPYYRYIAYIALFGYKSRPVSNYSRRYRSGRLYLERLKDFNRLREGISERSLAVLVLAY
ncbi:hypothetical protein QBC42DRAFT_248311 [Cladorrhinum samala]|uniref:Uncharacterized protein n=1 Tax=Cladorrhinum samala TaxID=585594 RepID=A0AAV9HY92_9PEZI|nr:hypothetical protein QBC42DRAFT_248311 [Cladorrhinum samala]